MPDAIASGFFYIIMCRIVGPKMPIFSILRVFNVT